MSAHTELSFEEPDMNQGYVARVDAENAKLRALNAELLSALKKCEHWMTWMALNSNGAKPVIKQAREAIAKAEAINQ